jgi:hypothetical protein
MHKLIHQIEEKRQAIFVGFFGPIGVSAIFYLYISLEFLETITVDGIVREDAAHLGEVFTVVVWFLAICSIVVHGLSIPLGKVGFFLPRTLSRAFTSQGNDEAETFPATESARTSNIGVLRERKRRSGHSTPTGSGMPSYRIGGTVIREDGASGNRTPGPGTPTGLAVDRTIRFPDEEPVGLKLNGTGERRDE